MSLLREGENMNQSDAQPSANYVTCRCQYCDKGIEFDASTFDKGETRTVPCPHCGLETIIFVPERRVPPVIPDERIVERAEKQLSNPPANSSRIGEDEEIIQQCIEIIRSKKEASVSLLNRHLKLGYTRAARIMDELANRGIVGPFKSAAEPRDILIDLNSGGYLRGDARWQTDLGIAYFRQKQYGDAVTCFVKAAEQGHPEARCNLGICYLDGLGVAKDEAEAVKWFSKAAQQENAHAEYTLGVAYFCGRGVAKDISTALKWWRRAAEHGSADAQHNLGVSYESGEGVIAQNYVDAYKWMKLAAAQGYEGATKKCEEIVLKMNAEQIAQVEPDHQILWKRERLTLKRLHDFIGQNRIKARLELAIAAAKLRNEALDHILVIGSPGSGKATLANIIAKVMGANLKTTSGPTITKAGDLAGLLTSCEAGDVIFIEEIHRLPRIIEEYLCPVTKDFKLDIIVDQGPNARSVRLNLPRFTLIGSTTTKERLTPNLLSCFRIIENMDDYSIDELAAIARRFATSMEVEIDADATDRIARSADGTPIDVLNRLQHVRDFAHVKGNGKITLEVAQAALKMLVSQDEKEDATESRDAIPSAIRREVWRRDEGKCVKCGSRANLEYDHIIPVSRGGSNTARNIELLCEACNRAKSDLIQ